MKKQILVEIISFTLILLLTYAATSKLLDYQKFRVQVGQSPLLTAFGGIISWSIPSLELIVSALLAIPKYRLIGLYGSFALMVLFTAYIIYILNLSVYVPCSCGGVLQNMGWSEHLIFNIFFSLLAASGVLLYDKCVPMESGSQNILLQ